MGNQVAAGPSSVASGNKADVGQGGGLQQQPFQQQFPMQSAQMASQMNTNLMGGGLMGSNAWNGQQGMMSGNEWGMQTNAMMYQQPQPAYPSSSMNTTQMYGQQMNDNMNYNNNQMMYGQTINGMNGSMNYSNNPMMFPTTSFNQQSKDSFTFIPPQYQQSHQSQLLQYQEQLQFLQQQSYQQQLNYELQQQQLQQQLKLQLLSSQTPYQTQAYQQQAMFTTQQQQMPMSMQQPQQSFQPQQMPMSMQQPQLQPQLQQQLQQPQLQQQLQQLQQLQQYWQAQTIQSQPPIQSSSSLKCDRCDGNHPTLSCPYYQEHRGTHIDAQKNGWRLASSSSSLPGAHVPRARVVPQPGDGSCLFHAIAYGLSGQKTQQATTATILRKEVCQLVTYNPSLLISLTPLRDWIQWEAGTTCAKYAQKMGLNSTWGGGIEMACLVLLKGINIHVYERGGQQGGFDRVAAFDHPSSPESRLIVRVLYRGRNHYDALVNDGHYYYQ